MVRDVRRHLVLADHRNAAARCREPVLQRCCAVLAHGLDDPRSLLECCDRDAFEGADGNAHSITQICMPSRDALAHRGDALASRLAREISCESPPRRVVISTNTGVFEKDEQGVALVRSSRCFECKADGGREAEEPCLRLGERVPACMAARSSERYPCKNYCKRTRIPSRLAEGPGVPDSRSKPAPSAPTFSISSSDCSRRWASDGGHT